MHPGQSAGLMLCPDTCQDAASCCRECGVIIEMLAAKSLVRLIDTEGKGVRRMSIAGVFVVCDLVVDALIDGEF